MTRPKQLLVEGKTTQYFFHALIAQTVVGDVQVQDVAEKDDLIACIKAISTICDNYEKGIFPHAFSKNFIPFYTEATRLLKTIGYDIQTQDFGGVSELEITLRGLVLESFYKQGGVKSIGIVRDAENDPKEALTSIQEALNRVGLPAPENVMVSAGADLRVTIFILPDAMTPGMLETLCLRAVQGDPVMPCIHKYVECVSKLGILDNMNDKALAQAFLASRQEAGLQVGIAAHRGCWNFDSYVFDDVKKFLELL